MSDDYLKPGKQLQDKPLLPIVRCLHCGKAKNQHRAITLHYPKGKKTTAGYLTFAETRFETAEPGC